MGIIQKDASRTMLISYVGIFLGYLNKGFLFVIVLNEIQLGLVNLLLTLGLLFAQLASLGVTYTIWKFLPYFKNQEKKHHGFLPYMLTYVLAGILFYTLLTVLFREQLTSYYLAKSPQFVDYYFLFLPIGIGFVFYLAFEAFLKSFYKNVVAVFSLEIVLRLCITTILLLFWSRWIDFDTFVIAHSVAYVIPTLILIIYIYRLGELNLSWSSIKISRRFKKVAFQFSAFNYLNSLGAIIVTSLDVLMIAQLLGLEPTGVYATIVFLASALLVPFRSILRISAPLVADYWKSKQFDKMKDLYTMVSSVSLFIGLALFSLVWLNIDFILSLPFLGPEFFEGKWVFFFLMMGRLLDMYFGLNGAIFSTSKKFKYDLIFTISLIVIVYSLNLLFIPWWGIAGAAISTGIALIVYNVGRVIFVWKIFNLHPFTLNQFKVIGLAIFTLFTWTQIAPLIVNEWLRAISSGFYLLVVFILPVFVFGWEKESKNYFLKITKMLGNKTHS